MAARGAREGVWLEQQEPLRTLRAARGCKVHLTRCLRTLRATSGGRARRARRALVRASCKLAEGAFSGTSGGCKATEVPSFQAPLACSCKAAEADQVPFQIRHLWWLRAKGSGQSNRIWQVSTAWLLLLGSSWQRQKRREKRAELSLALTRALGAAARGHQRWLKRPPYLAALQPRAQRA